MRKVMVREYVYSLFKERGSHGFNQRRVYLLNPFANGLEPTVDIIRAYNCLKKIRSGLDL